MKVKIIKPYEEVELNGVYEATLQIDDDIVVLREDLVNSIRYLKVNNNFEDIDELEDFPLKIKVIQLLNEHALDEFDDFPSLDFLTSDVEFIPKN